MGIVPKAVHELLDVLVDERVMDDVSKKELCSATCSMGYPR
jgi:hypothetical protein